MAVSQLAKNGHQADQHHNTFEEVRIILLPYYESVTVRVPKGRLLDDTKVIVLLKVAAIPKRILFVSPKTMKTNPLDAAISQIKLQLVHIHRMVLNQLRWSFVNKLQFDPRFSTFSSMLAETLWVE